MADRPTSNSPATPPAAIKIDYGQLPGAILAQCTFRGVCHVYLATDLGFGIDIARAEHMLGRGQIAQHFRRPRLAPEPSQLQRHSFRVSQPGAEVVLLISIEIIMPFLPKSCSH